MSEMNDKRWELHAEFLGELADRVAWMIIAQGSDRTEAVNEYTRWLSEKCFKHAQKHIMEDFGKVVDEPLVDDISVSGDRVKREELNIGSSWDAAKRESHVYENADSVGYEGIDDDSVIKTQEECAKRFAEGEAVRRNYAGIND